MGVGGVPPLLQTGILRCHGSVDHAGGEVLDDCSVCQGTCPERLAEVEHGRVAVYCMEIRLEIPTHRDVSICGLNSIQWLESQLVNFLRCAPQT